MRSTVKVYRRGQRGRLRIEICVVGGATSDELDALRAVAVREYRLSRPAPRPRMVRKVVAA